MIMFKVESGNEYRWLNKDARELKSGLLHIEDKLTLQRTDLESHDTNTSILPSINHKVNTVYSRYHVRFNNLRHRHGFSTQQKTAVSYSDQPLYALVELP